MTLSSKQIKETSDYWKNTAEHDWGTVQALWKAKRYDACLFYCHLTMEKFLKGLVVLKSKDNSPFIHDLVELAKRANLDLDEEKIKALAVFTSFNLRGRYARDKFGFYELCTYKFTKPYFEQAKNIIVWLKKSYQKSK